MRRVEDFTREELDEINQVKHIEENNDDLNVNENNKNKLFSFLNF
jgi:hypothetical protein